MNGNSDPGRERSASKRLRFITGALVCGLGLLGIGVLSASASAQSPEPASVRIDVLSLFHPRVLTVLAKGATTSIRAEATGLSLVTSGRTAEAAVFTLAATTFRVTVPGKLTRTYCGALRVSSHGGMLVAVVTLPTEVAVASIVAAEAPADAPFEALRAQAVASRSYLLANLKPGAQADSCDTTRCQFLRSPPPAGSPAARATATTRNQVLTWRASPESSATIVPAMYSRSCGGHTRAHPTTPGAYPFYAVPCDFCLRHPEAWQRQGSPETAATESRTETGRLAYNRVHGWSAIPSNTYRETASGSLEGRGTGHGLGLCQLGSADLARRGQTYATILAHFFPNTTLTTLP